MKFPSKRNSFTITPKGWGKEVHIHNTQDYCGKLLELEKGGTCSLHFHINKVETFYILKGRVALTLFHDLNEEEVVLNQEEAINIPRFLAHSFRGLEESTILEISTFDDPNDSVRIAPGDSQIKCGTVPIDEDKHREWEERCKRINGKS
tara:strand:- start:838 stop:1284 length:447 start_codon:yes stop_codon:yes gene_type:complete